jgi:hypothetical protein
MLSVTQDYLASDVWMIVNNEREKIRKETVVGVIALLELLHRVIVVVTTPEQN